MNDPIHDFSHKIPISLAERYESSVPDDVVVNLNTLCDPCSAFVQNSTLVQLLGRQKSIKIDSQETGHVGSPVQLKDGYMSGRCHLCALLWTRARGYLLDPARPFRSDIDPNAPVEVKLVARDVEKEYKITVESGEWAKKLKWKFVPTPPMLVLLNFSCRLDSQFKADRVTY